MAGLRQRVGQPWQAVGSFGFCATISPSRTGETQMAKGRNFKVVVKEPADSRTTTGYGVALQFEFHTPLPNMSGRSLWLSLAPSTTMEQAEALARELNSLGEGIAVR
jgi:hypothetical protein